MAEQPPVMNVSEPVPDEILHKLQPQVESVII